MPGLKAEKWTNWEAGFIPEVTNMQGWSHDAWINRWLQ